MMSVAFTVLLFLHPALAASATEPCQQSQIDDREYYFNYEDATGHRFTPAFTSQAECQAVVAKAQQLNRLPKTVCGCEFTVSARAVASGFLLGSQLPTTLYCYDTSESGVTSQTAIDSWSYSKYATSNDGNLESCERRKNQYLGR